MDIENLTSFMQDFNLVQFLLLCLTIYALTFVVRLTVEGVTGLFASTKAFKNSQVWRGWLLKILPITIGTIFAVLAKSFPYPLIAESGLVRAAEGAVAGLLSAMIYSAAKKKIRALGKKPPTTDG